MRVRVVRSIHDLDEERWDSLGGVELSMTHRWHRVMEASRLAYRPRYLLAEDERGPLVGIVADTNQASGRSRMVDMLVRPLTLVVGAPFSSRHCGIVRRPDASIDHVHQLLAQLSRSERRPLLGVANVGAPALPDWSGRGFHARAQPPRMVLELTAATYEQYLEDLPKRHRQEVRRVRRRASEADVTLSQAPLHGQAAGLLYPLLAEVSGRHGSRLFSPEVFPALARELPSEVMVFCAAVHGEVAGFVLAVQTGSAILAVLAGLRYALAYPSSLYFVLIDELVRWSLEHGVQRIHAGISNEAQKQRHGFQPHARWLCVRAFPDSLNWLAARAT
ncbi:MAG TPA: GNAT family N-acetyltransferase [Chloroflexota bacterium]|nr:GNAT family N-acetyltransferase [Chloroflexota bacterium]